MANVEQRAIRWILPRIPESVTPLHLTFLGLFGSFLAGIALVGCNWSLSCLPWVAIGIVINWFGDSFDGSLARYRIAERPRFGFLVDHTCDLFSQVFIIICFGLSPFLSLMAAFTVLLCYLLFSAYTYLRAAVQNVHQMAYIGVGATEFRILMVGWALIGSVVGLHESSIGGNGLSRLDLVIMLLGGSSVIGLAIKASADARAIAAEEQKHLDQAASQNAGRGIPAYLSGDEVGG